MSFALVANQFGETENLSGGTVANLQKAFPSNITATDVIDIGGSYGDTGSGTGPTLTDSVSDSYSAVVTKYDGGHTEGVFKSHAFNAAGGATTVTCSFAANNSFCSLHIGEYSGALTASDPLDQTGTAEGTSGVGSLAVTTGGNLASDNEGVTTFCALLSGSATIVTPSGFSGVTTGTLPDAQAETALAGGSGGPTSATWTFTGVTGDVPAAIIFTYKTQAAAAALTTPGLEILHVYSH